VIILSENCSEWPLAYFGIALAGAVSVPLLTGFSPDQVRSISGHAGASAIILSRAMVVKIEEPLEIPLIFLDNITDYITVSIEGHEKRIPLPAQENGQFPRREPDDLATIIYTSGTLGNSKGVMLSGTNLISCALSSEPFAKIHPRDRLLSVLPLAHSYECTLGLLIPVISGASITYLDRPPSPSILLPVAKALRPTIMFTVPIFIEKIYRNTIAPALLKSRLYHCPLTRPLVIRLAGRKLAMALGGSIRFFGIGGAPLSEEVESFLRRARFPHSPGYGLTEFAPLVTGSAPHRFPFRSVGIVPKGVELRIAADKTHADSVGEIQVRGPQVMMGYYRDEAETRKAFTADGWLRTGDLGRIDSKGKLFVRGRLKALILGPSGENIYPEEIEGLLGSSHLVEEVLVYSGEKGELVAMVRLSDAAKTAVNVLEHALEELRIWANKKLAKFSRLSRIEVRQEPFEKTPTMKIKRHRYIQYQEI
jgi:long-chain acyl-CoA synthetase